LNVVVVATALGAPPHRPRDVKETDHRRYIALAAGGPWSTDSRATREAPFCFRVLAPGLVHAATRAGADLHVAFWTLSTLSSALFLFVLSRHLAFLGFSWGTTALGMALAGLTPGAVRWYAYQYWMPDPLCLLLVVLGFHLVVARRHRALGLVAIPGLLTRESFLVVVVYAMVKWVRIEGARVAARRGLGVFGVSLMALGALHLSMAPVAGPSLLSAASEMLAFRARHLFDNQLYFATLGTFGVVVPLLVARAPWALGQLRHHLEDVAVAATVYASLAVANNTDRLLVYALPVLIPAALHAFLAVARAARVLPGTLGLVVLGLQALVYLRTPFAGIAGLSLYQPVQWSIVVVLSVFGALCALAPLLRRSS
jgi:hypothetical protein